MLALQADDAEAEAGVVAPAPGGRGAAEGDHLQLTPLRRPLEGGQQVGGDRPIVALCLAQQQRRRQRGDRRVGGVEGQLADRQAGRDRVTGRAWHSDKDGASDSSILQLFLFIEYSSKNVKNCNFFILL